MLFHTFAIVSPKCEKVISTLRTSDWALTTCPDPSGRFWETKDYIGRSVSKHCQYNSGINSDMVPSIEIVIKADNIAIADNLRQLIYGGILLAYPDTCDNLIFGTPIESGTMNPEFLKDEPFCSQFQYYENGEIGCRIAEAIWGSRERMYALEKLKLSWKLDCVSPHSPAPHYGQIFQNVMPELGYHVNAAFAIIAAFSAIEELGLEIRSSNKKKRFLDKAYGTWNPEVFGDTERRLKEANVDLDEEFIWVYRGEPTDVERSIEPILGEAAPYSDGKTVRDRKMHIIDAIHYVSYIRNFIAAHRFSEIVQTLSPYDVYNAQDLARRLIMSQAGFWRHPDYFR